MTLDRAVHMGKLCEKGRTTMNIWQPDAGETLLSRAPVSFATGAAAPVRGMRWFRDTERNDIQGELRNWPEGPTFTARSAGEAAALKALKGAAKLTGVAFMAVLSAAGGNVSGSPHAGHPGADTPDDPADEVDDFPVMWAAPGTIARTLPWQLDPGRSDEKRYSTHLIVTDRRLVVVGLPFNKKDMQFIDDEVLWQCPRADLRSLDLKDFKDGNDFKLTFEDGSWCRLTSMRRRRLTRYLTPPRELISLESLTPQQRTTVSEFATKMEMPDSVTPIITRNPTGRLRVEILLPRRYTSAFGASEQTITMETDGKRVDIENFLPEDF
ncbi:hypothetical protein [Streptomyces sp. enrichment culture]|uniref:hypothetical protein n=1 Tax=Streptomyces sp. enrichment culture TaxID=1795815 RepID=UPI003F55791F